MMAHVSRPPPRFEALDSAPIVPAVDRGDGVPVDVEKAEASGPVRRRRPSTEVQRVHDELFGSGRSRRSHADRSHRHGPRTTRRASVFFLAAVTIAAASHRGVDRGASCEAPAPSPIEAYTPDAAVVDAAPCRPPGCIRTGRCRAAATTRSRTRARPTRVRRPVIRVQRPPPQRIMAVTLGTGASACWSASNPRSRWTVMPAPKRAPTTVASVTLTFVVRARRGSPFSVEPEDDAGRAYRRCLSFRLPKALAWPPATIRALRAW